MKNCSNICVLFKGHASMPLRRSLWQHGLPWIIFVTCSMCLTQLLGFAQVSVHLLALFVCPISLNVVLLI